MREAESERGGEIRGEFRRGDFWARGPDREHRRAFRELPPFVNNIVKMQLGNLREADLRSGANQFAVAAGRDMFFGGNRQTERGIADK